MPILGPALLPDATAAVAVGTAGQEPVSVAPFVVIAVAILLTAVAPGNAGVEVREALG